MAARRWQDAKEILARLVATPRFGLLSDLDGTLSPIAPTPEAAQITPRNRELFAELRNEIPLVAIISGRRAASLQERVGLPGLLYIGNHGLECWTDGQVEIIPEAAGYLEVLQVVKRELEKSLEPGAYIEDKEATLSFHYRQTANPGDFARRHGPEMAQVVEAHGLSLFTGKMVFEVRPPVAMDKGIAFRQLVGERKIDAALFLGDDISDLNAMEMARKMRTDKICDSWSAGVQSEEAPETLAAAADFLAVGVEDVEELLAWLLKARRASST